MTYLDRIDRVFRPVTLTNLTNILVFGQAAMWLYQFADPGLPLKIALVWAKVLQGEVWRLITFAFVPPGNGMFPVLTLFYFYIFHMIGNAIERMWGDTRYTAYLGIGIVLTILASIVNPDMVVTGLFLELTVFLAFAAIAPNYEFLIMFVLPVKVKYLAALQVGFYLLLIALSPGWSRLVPLAAISNYFLFFAPRLRDRWIGSKRKMNAAAARRANEALADRPRHVCEVCKIDSRTHPKMQFRYCSRCGGQHAYCEAHLHDHPHVTGGDE